MQEGKYTAFIDILGISGLTEKRYDIAKEKIQQLHDLFYATTQNHRERIIQSIAFSDCIILIFNTLSDAINICTEIFNQSFKLNFINAYSSYISDVKDRYILLRGAISSGEIFVRYDKEQGNEIFISGNSLVRSVKYEGFLKGSRLLLVDQNVDNSEFTLIDIIEEKDNYNIYEVYWPNYDNECKPLDNIKIIKCMCEEYTACEESIFKHYSETLYIFLKSYLKKYRHNSFDILKDLIREVFEWNLISQGKHFQNVINLILSYVTIDRKVCDYFIQNHIMGYIKYVAKNSVEWDKKEA